MPEAVGEGGSVCRKGCLSTHWGSRHDAREVLAGFARAADSVQVCAAAPTCGGRLLSGLRRTVVSKEGISRFFLGGENVQIWRMSVGTVGKSNGVFIFVGQS